MINNIAVGNRLRSSIGVREREWIALHYILELLLAVMANVAVYCICKQVQRPQLAQTTPVNLSN